MSSWVGIVHKMYDMGNERKAEKGVGFMRNGLGWDGAVLKNVQILLILSDRCLNKGWVVRCF